MARTAREITDAELAVLEALWACEAASVRELAATLYPGGGNSESATVQKLCERLMAKGYIDRDRGVRPTTFHALLGRQDLIGRQLRSVADRLCAGSLAPLLTHLVEIIKLDPGEIENLRDQVARLDRARRVATVPDDDKPEGRRDE